MHATLKPHHFMDLIYKTAALDGVFGNESPFGNDVHVFGNLLASGKIDSITFTSGVDDICKPCNKLSDGICTVIFSEEVAKRYGVERQYEYNLGLDTSFAIALPEVFSFGTERSIESIYDILKEKLTDEIILLNWPIDNRVEMTYRGLDMVISARKANK